MGAIVGASITCHLAFGPNAGRKALTVQTVPVKTERRRGDDLVAKQAGFSLDAGIACESHQRKKLERLCRYVTRPAIAQRRLSLANNRTVVIALDIEKCEKCSGSVRIIALIEDPDVIQKILKHLGLDQPQDRSPPSF